jgi:release factor glutamine methyltransferase
VKIPSNRIKSIVQYAKEQLHGLYPEEEINNLIFLVFEHYLNFKRTDFALKANDTVSESDLLKLHFAIKRLRKSEPVQYILGETWFYGLKFKVNNHVLIPRQETEELVDWVIKDFQKDPHKPTKPLIIDMGTGSGCIAISLKKNIEKSVVYAIDLSEDALNVAKENAVSICAPVSFFKEDILKPEKLKLPLKPYLIVSNPPYICKSEKNLMHSNVLNYEPHSALFVKDNDPLVYYKAIADFAINNLAEGGKLYMEINERFGKEIVSLLERKGFKNIELRKDIPGKDRMVKGEN